MSADTPHGDRGAGAGPSGASSGMVAAMLGYAGLEVAMLVPTVIFWVFVLGVADLATMLVLWAVRVTSMVALWTATQRPAQRWYRQGRELGDRELRAIDEAMAGAPRRFMRVYTGVTLATLALGTGLGVLGIPQVVEFGLSELVTSTMLAVAIAVIVMTMEHWLFSPFEGARTELGALLRERGLVGRRVPATIVRSQLMLTVGTALALFVGCCGMGWMLHVVELRNTTLAEQGQLVLLEAARLRDDEHAALSAEGLVIVGGSELPAGLGSDPRIRAGLDVGFARTELAAAAPIADGRWLLAHTEVDEQLGWFLLFVGVVGTALAAPLVGTTLAQARSLSGQLLGLGRLTRRVVETGEIRGLARVVSLRNDEVDALVKDFNAMLDMFDELTDAATRVAGGDLRVELERPGDLHDAFRGMIERLHEVVVGIRGAALELASAAAEIYSITQNQEQAAQRQSTSVSEVSATVASLAASAQNITETSTGVLDNAEQTLDATRSMIARIAELRRHADGVSELLDGIREIADRSDLLALNGSLEATRAGEAGRGFALVAAEMRRLAERVTLTVGTVREQVVEINSSGSSAVAVAEDSRALAEQTAAAARHISLVTGQQGRETEQTARNVHEVAEVVISTSAAITQTRAAAEGLKLQADQLERLTGQFALRE